MFEEGNLLYFDPFLFKNGAAPKPKFFIVLKNDTNDEVILATLPTSKDHIPSDVAITSGCTELPDRAVNVYVFLADTPVTTNGYCFKVNTFIYGADIDTYPSKIFKEQMSNNQIKVSAKGKLKQEIFYDLLYCLRNSKMVKRKFKKVL